MATQLQRAYGQGVKHPERRRKAINPGRMYSNLMFLDAPVNTTVIHVDELHAHNKHHKGVNKTRMDAEVGIEVLQEVEQNVGKQIAAKCPRPVNAANRAASAQRVSFFII